MKAPMSRDVSTSCHVTASPSPLSVSVSLRETSTPRGAHLIPGSHVPPPVEPVPGVGNTSPARARKATPRKPLMTRENKL